MHTNEQVFKVADKTVELLYSLDDYDNEKNVDVFVTLEKDGQSYDYIAVYTKKSIDKVPTWVQNNIKGS
ncbi:MULTISPECIES: hypothetical protein [unclassified Mucilaginibacter]|uniref:hypothetical protein n=1 Tax=unclassified Mucilaginibacter TaxID=2617802 RepID=UPI002AC90FDF|nr:MULTISPECIES: hypothetical protein [unclassified Mucilaginibacter]MEB0262183.1 hypothetical protein [Mucilaginibacter sp. 10I4]MEB0277043.1 hypothetical protein [Mucilaginibacter sp. 10B2]MEB0302644.1 hypothetical protein [Mucilaginibacter sp. 5C4]WPX25144.1 hypothetical protein RHM67_07675 [Mucilaginibacter sp. 5C4]